MKIADVTPLAWPLVLLVISLFVIWRVGEDTRTLIRWMAATAKEQAGKHAIFFAVVVGFGMQAFGTGFYDNFWPIEPENMAKLGWWQVLAALLKSMSFAIGIMVGYLLKRPETAGKGDSVTLSTTETKTESVVNQKT